MKRKSKGDRKRLRRNVDLADSILSIGKEKSAHDADIVARDCHIADLQLKLANVTANRDSLQREKDGFRERLNAAGQDIMGYRKQLADAETQNYSLRRELGIHNACEKIGDWCLVVLQVCVSLAAVSGLVYGAIWILLRIMYG